MEPVFGVYSFRKLLEEKSIMFAFTGIMSQDFLSLIGLNLKRREKNHVISRRLFAIVIEVAQNIHHYSAQKKLSVQDAKKVGYGTLIITHDEECYQVISGNWMSKDSVEYVKERCEHVNSLSPFELREYYKQELAKPRRGIGGNVGFLDMVRKSGNPVEIDFFPIDDNEEHIFFVLSVKINRI